MAVAVGELVPREHAGEVSGDEALHECLERRAHAAARPLEAAREEGAEGAMLAQDAPGGEAERHEIMRAVEAVVKPVEGAGVRGAIEFQHESMGRLPHPCQRPLDPGPEEIDAAVGQARRQERDDLPVGGVGIAERIANRVSIDAPRPVGLAAELLERCLQPGRGGHPVTSRGRS